MWGSDTRHQVDPAVALTRLLMALRTYLRSGTTGNRERLAQALDIYDGTDR